VGTRRHPPTTPTALMNGGDEVLDDDAVEHCVRNGRLRRLDMSQTTPVDATTLERLREQMARRLGAKPVHREVGRKDDDDGGSAA